MDDNRQSPFDKEPAEGSRETVDRQLEEQERKAPGNAGQQQDAAGDRANNRKSGG